MFVTELGTNTDNGSLSKDNALVAAAPSQQYDGMNDPTRHNQDDIHSKMILAMEETPTDDRCNKDISVVTKQQESKNDNDKCPNEEAVSTCVCMCWSFISISSLGLVISTRHTK